MTTIQIVLISIIIFLIIGIIVFVMINGDSKEKQKKLDLIRGNSGGSSNIDEKELQNKRRAEIAKKLKTASKEGGSADEEKVSVTMKLQQAGSSMSAKTFWILSVVSCLAFLVAAKIMAVSMLVMVLMGITGFFGLPKFILSKAIKKRQKNFLEEFADALDAVVRLLQAGMPVAEAVKMISREFDGPVGEEMSIIYDKQKIGIPLHEAALEGTKRMPLPEMKMFAAGLAIQAQTGSSLSEVLSNLSRVIRARFRLKRKVMALSSEAISSASIIGALPPLVGTGLWFVNPEYLEPLFTTPTGKNMIMGGIFWMSCGIMVMKKMINFRI